MKYTPGSKKPVGKDRWKARFFYYEENGTKREVSRNYVAKGEREAERKKLAIHEQLEREAVIEQAIPEAKGGRRAFVDYASSYIERRAAAHLIEPTTAANYRNSLKIICRHLPDVTVAGFTSDMLLDLDSKLLADGLCPDTVAKAHRLIKQILESATDSGHIQRNPITRSTKPPKRLHREPNSLDDETRRHVLAILDNMRDSSLTLAIRLGLACGLRNEEACGLMWDDVDLRDGHISIAHCITCADGRIVEKGPKTSAGYREIPLDPDLTSRLQARRELALEMTSTGHGMRGLYVLGKPTGGFYHPTFLTKDFRSFADTNGIYGVTGKLATYYSLRHTFATMLLRKGVDAKTVSSLMGHSTVAETLDTYASTDPLARAAAGRKISAIMAER